MYGESATKLIKHITGEVHGDFIPEYQYELVEQVVKENDELYAENLRTSQSGVANNKEESVSNAVDDNNPASQDEDRDTQVDDNIDIGEKEIMVMQIRHTAKLWNKRCIIAYHYERLKQLKRLRWDYGNNLPREIVKNLSKSELEWFTKYNDNLFSYMSALNDGKGIDLTLHVTPPKKLYIQVKCIRDYGQFELEDGQPVMLKKDSIHFLPIGQCEKLIHQGVLEQILR